MQYEPSRCKSTWNEQIISYMVLFLVFQPDVSTSLYTFCFETLMFYATSTKQEKIFIMLGDLLDPHFFGTKSQHSFEKRMKMYVTAKDNSRLISVLSLVHQRVQDKKLKIKLEKTMCYMMHLKEYYTAEDIIFLVRYSFMGTSIPLSPNFKNIQFGTYKSSFLQGKQDNKTAKGYVSMLDDMLLQLKNVLIDEAKSSRASSVVGRIRSNLDSQIDASSKKKSPPAKTKTEFDDPRYKWAENLLYSSQINLEECLKGLDILSVLGYEEFLFPMFTALNLLQDPTSKRIALRLKTQYQGSEVLPLILFYLISESKGSEKKVSSNFHDCLLRLFNKVNTLKIRRSRGDEKGSIAGIEPSLQKRFGAPPFAESCITFTPRERDFSLFYDNSFLYFRAFRYLFENNLNTLSQMFLKACQQETHLMLTSRGHLAGISLRQVTLAYKLLSTEEQANKELQEGLLRLLLLRRGDALDEKLIKLGFLYKCFQAEENFSPHLLFLAEMAVNKDTPQTEELQQQTQFVDYVLSLVESKKYYSFLSAQPEFEAFAAAQFNPPGRAASDNQTAHKQSHTGNRSAEKEASAAGGSTARQRLPSTSGLGLGDILSAANQRCPTEFYSPFFAVNDLGCLVDPLVFVEKIVFEGFVEYPLTHWVKSLAGDKGPERVLDYAFESAPDQDSNLPQGDFTDAVGVKRLTDDFFAVTQAYIAQLDGEAITDQKPDGGAKSEEVPVFQTSIAALNQPKALADYELFVDYYAVKHFTKKVATAQNIRVLRTEDIMINDTKNICPDYLREEGVVLHEGLISANGQKCNIFKVNVLYADHLKRISANLEFMNMYSPLVVKYLGMIFNENFDGNGPFVIFFVVDHWEATLLDYCKQHFGDAANLKEFKREQFEITYRLLYFCNVMLKTDMFPPLLNPQSIMITKNNYPLVLIPFFSSSYLSPKSYLENLFKSTSLTDMMYFSPPNCDQLLEVTTLILQMKASKNFSLTSISQAGSDHHQGLVAGMMSACYRCILLIFTGQVPLTGLVSKSTTPAQLQTMLATPAKTSALLSKLWSGLKKKTPSTLRGMMEEISNFFNNPTSNKMSELLDLMRKELGGDLDLFANFVAYNLSIVAAANFIEEPSGTSMMYDRQGSDGMQSSPEAPVRKVVYLPSKMVFNGYFGPSFIQSAKLYQSNQMMCSITLENTGNQSNPGPYHPYLVEYHLEESKSLLLKIYGNQLSEVTYLIKNPTSLQGKNSTTPAERKIVFAKFFDNSWVPNEHVWLNILKPQFAGDCEEVRSKSFKMEGNFSKNTATSILNSERSQTMHELFAQLYFSFNKLCMIRSFNTPHIVDLFGNIVNWNPFPPIPEINLAKYAEQQQATSGLGTPKISATITGSDWLIIRSQVPTQMVRTILFNNSISPTTYFKIDLSQFVLRSRSSAEERSSLSNTVTSEQYFNLVRELSVADVPNAPKHRAIVTFTEGGQFWGWCKHSRPLHGRFYSTSEDFNTVSDEEIYDGQLCASSRNFKYLGYLEKNLPQYFGEYYLNNQLVYRGGIERGTPDGKGQLFNSKGDLMFDGFLQDGFPVSGVFYKLPRIFVGKFSIPAKSNYRFSFKKLDLFIKSLQYENMMSSFSLQGEIRNYTADVKVIRGFFSHDNTLLKGDFYLRSKEGKVYIGEMNESRKEGLGLMILPTGQTILGRWKGNTVNGVFRCPIKPQDTSRPLGAESYQVEPKLVAKIENAGVMNISRNHESQSRFEDMKKQSVLNKIPVEVRGHFEIHGENLLLMDSGSIRFEDGSVYTGGILNNKMSGYGSLKYASGDHCEGIWKNNQLTGIGFYASEHFIYEGQFKNSVWHGFGRLCFHSDGRIIKGEWENGRLKYALLDEFEPNNNFFQIDRITIRVEDETNFFKMGITELVGTAHVLFKEKAPAIVKDGATSPSQGNEHANTFVMLKEVQNKTDEASEHGPKSKERNSASTSIVHQFLGIFTRLDEKSTFDGFNKGQIVALGMIVKGSEVIFTGVADYKFSMFFGVKYDHETQTELRGYFNSNLKLNGIGAQHMLSSEYVGNFRKNHKHGLVIKIRDGFTVFVGEYTDDVKNGYGLRFQEEIAVGSIGEIQLGTTPRSTATPKAREPQPLGVKEGVRGVLTEYAYGKLKRIFYALD